MLCWHCDKEAAGLDGNGVLGYDSNSVTIQHITYMQTICAAAAA
jgi:hypothetical protein